MGISLGIIFGIIAMISWGIADFLIAKIVRKVNVFKTLVWSQSTGLIFFIIIFSFFFKFPSISLSTFFAIYIVKY